MAVNEAQMFAEMFAEMFVVENYYIYKSIVVK
jgi:hypothetical protein